MPNHHDLPHRDRQHFSLNIADLTPAERPAELTDEMWARIEKCAATGDKDPVETLECMTDGGGGETCDQVTPHPDLKSVLYVLANRKG